jgi:CheY-like chemotaxis protein
MSLAMIVDDDEDIRFVFREILQRGGFDLVVAADADEAIQLLGEHTPDIVFIDMNMPQRPGTDVLVHIQATPRLAQTKTIVVTANARAENKAAELGADLLLIKPIAIGEMLRLAKRLAGNADTP